MAGAAPGFEKYPNYEVAREAQGARVRVLFDGTLLASSDRAVRVLETRHQPVRYFPRSDVRMDLLERSEHTTFCPFKGEASYYSVQGAGKAGKNLIWTYEDPYDEVADLEGLVAFYADRVVFEEG